jgi:hypothetical protein
VGLFHLAIPLGETYDRLDFPFHLDYFVCIVNPHCHSSPVANWLIARGCQVSVTFCTILTRYTDLEVQDYASLLGIQDGYRLAAIDIQPGSRLADKTLKVPS